VPREFVFLDELPRNATGKVLKRELKDDEDGDSDSDSDNDDGGSDD
jgi:acyl-CoA synthetase (AMP-forming)/AMP-acid ligase II